MDWKYKQVLVCGGAGMIGAHLSKRLRDLGARVTIVDNLSSGSKQNIVSDVLFMEGDLRDRDLARQVTLHQDAVFQLAADMGGIAYITSIGAQIMQNSARINLNIIDACHENNVGHIFYSSSACIYPEYRQLDPNSPNLKEVDAYPAQPDQFYGWEKLFTEKLCEAYIRDYGMNIKVARFHNIMGHGYTSFDKAKAKAPCQMLVKTLQNRPIEVWGDGKQTRSFLYIEDCLDAILLLMASDYHQPINIGSDYGISMTDLAKLVRKVAMDCNKYQVASEIVYIPGPQGVRGRNADLATIEQVLHWHPKVTLEEGLKEIYVWAREHYLSLEGIQ